MGPKRDPTKTEKPGPETLAGPYKNWKTGTLTEPYKNRKTGTRDPGGTLQTLENWDPNGTLQKTATLVRPKQEPTKTEKSGP